MDAGPRLLLNRIDDGNQSAKEKGINFEAAVQRERKRERICDVNMRVNEKMTG